MKLSPRLFGISLLALWSGSCGSPSWNGEVQRWGDVREVLVDGRKPRQVGIEEFLGDPALVGIGTLSGTGGDLVVFEGELTRGFLDATGRPTVDREASGGAALVLGAVVHGWQEIRLERSIEGEHLERDLRRLANEHGLAGHASFPFLFEGRLWGLEAVVQADPSAASGLGGDTRRLHLDRAYGRVIGFYSDLAPGTLTVPGSLMQAKVLIAGEQPYLGHLERVSLPVGATLLLPEAP